MTARATEWTVRALVFSIVTWLGSWLPAACAATGLPTEGDAYEVRRLEVSAPDQATLRFLGENREFFRARLDELRVRLREDWTGVAQIVDPDWLEMLDAIAAARDSMTASDEKIRRDELFESVAELLELEQEMDRMDQLLEAQETRLAQLEDDFVGRQQTAVVVLLRGVPSFGAPASAVLRDADGRAHRIALSDVVASALERGGSAELLHRLVEPRAQTWSISLERPGIAPVAFDLPLDPARDRMTFVEIDASGVEGDRAPDTAAGPGGGQPALTWWVR